MNRLQRAREIAGAPFDIRNGSGWRCEEHNREVGGTPESSHLTGHAVDIPAWSSEQRFAIINGLIKAGFKRIGIAKTFIHADDSAGKPQNIMWTY
jgi:phage terminase large subunit-like protein